MNRQSLLRLVRGLGVLSLGAAAATFLFHDWRVDALHFYKLLALTAAFSGMGVLLGIQFKEPRGARAFLLLSLVAVPMCFAALGGVLFVQPWIEGGLTIVIALPVLLAVTAFGMAGLFRAKWAPLTLATMLSGSLLVIPMRDVGLLSALAVAMLALLGWIDRRIVRSHPAAATAEGWLTRLCVVAPLLIGWIRTVLYYEWAQASFVAATLAAAAMALLAAAGHVEYVAKREERSQSTATALHCLALFPMFGAALFLPGALGLSAARFYVLWVSLFFTAGVVAAAGSRRWMFDLAAVGVVLGLSFELCLSFLFPRGSGSVFLVMGFSERERFVVALLALLVAGSVIWLGYGQRRFAAFCAGAGGTVLAIAALFALAVERLSVPSWVPLSGCGLLLILGASLVERKGHRLKQRARTLGLHFASQGAPA